LREVLRGMEVDRAVPKTKSQKILEKRKQNFVLTFKNIDSLIGPCCV